MHFPCEIKRGSHAFIGSMGNVSGSRRARWMLLGAALSVSTALLGGCDVKSFIDPGEMGRYARVPLQKPILTSLSSIDRSIDDPDDEFINATDTKPEDLQVIAKDYQIGVGDLVNVSVTDLVGPGVETTKTSRVSESGNVSMPLVGDVHAIGLTEAQLQQAISDAYKNANLIQNAQVSVTVAEARARTFSALGAVVAAGQYAILQSDFRMLDALVMVKDVDANVTTVYVIRDTDQDPGAASPGAPGTAIPPSTPGGTPTDPLAPHSQANPTSSDVALLQTAGNSDHQILLPNGQPAGANEPAAVPPVVNPTGAGAAEVPAAVAPVAPAAPAATSFQFANPKPPSEKRVIRIPLDALKNGDLRYNIVIRPRDLIVAPNPVVGEYYLGGHIARTGVYSLSGRRITLKQAIISAGMLDGVAIPQRCDIIRRLGTDREVFARVDLNAIFDGTQPDIFLKPYDSVMVGTNFFAPFIADARNGGRITYGAGFLYDRNFAVSSANGNGGF